MPYKCILITFKYKKINKTRKFIYVLLTSKGSLVCQFSARKGKRLRVGSAWGARGVKDYTVRGRSNVWRLPKSKIFHPPRRPAEGGHTRWVERGRGVNILEDARHCSVLYICKYFVARCLLQSRRKGPRPNLLHLANEQQETRAHTAPRVLQG
jgi:hypothetical protein